MTRLAVVLVGALACVPVVEGGLTSPPPAAPPSEVDPIVPHDPHTVILLCTAGEECTAATRHCMYHWAYERGTGAITPEYGRTGVGDARDLRVTTAAALLAGKEECVVYSYTGEEVGASLRVASDWKAVPGTDLMQMRVTWGHPEWPSPWLRPGTETPQ